MLLRRADQPPVSLSTPLDDQDTEPGDLLAGTEPGPEPVVTDATRAGSSAGCWTI
jgi:hypothetical protein